MTILIFSLLFANAGVFEDNLQKMRDSKKYPALIKIQYKRSELELSSNKVNCQRVVVLLTDLLKDSVNQPKLFTISDEKIISLYMKQYDLCFDLKGENLNFDEQFQVLKSKYYFNNYIQGLLAVIDKIPVKSKMVVASSLAGYLNRDISSEQLRKKILVGVDEYLLNNKDTVSQYLVQSLTLFKASGHHGLQQQ